MPPTSETLQRFQQKAEAVSAVVTHVPSLAEAFAYTVTLCENKEACRLLISGCEENLSPAAGELCESKPQKLIAAPSLDASQADSLAAMCRERGIRFIQEGLRDHLAGIDIGFTPVQFGIAETGTLVIDSSSEEVRLATMISEVHIALLPRSAIRESAYALETELQGWMKRSPNYTAFITGASRTADIERVLALGVHGPLELHILILEDD